MKKSLFSFFLFSLIGISVHAVTLYSVGDIVKSYALPIYFNGASVYGSITQQIYLASELTDQGAEEGDKISSITFYYTAKDGGSVGALSRPIQIWLLAIPSSTVSYTVDAVPWQSGAGYYGYSNFLCDGSNQAGTHVYTGNLATEAVSSGTVKTVKITFNQDNFTWDGSSNIALTVCDMSTSSHTVEADSYADLRFQIQYTGVETPRFVYKQWRTGNTDTRSSWLANLVTDYGDFYPYGTGNTSVQKQKENRSWVNKVDFTFSSSVPAPTSPTSSSITSSSATIGWAAAAGADSYEVRYGTTSGSLGDATNVGNVTSYNLSELEDGVTYYFQIRTKKGSEYSAWTDEASFTTTTITHEHNGISFLKWASTSSMPTSGNYYLANDVTYDFYEGGYLDLAGDLNLCLNGHTINLGTKSINVTSSKTMTIYDPVGGGKITGLVPGDAGSVTFKGVISVENNGTLVLREGGVENTYPNDDPDYKSIAIAVGGTLILSGAPVISSNEIDIFLPPTIPAKVITIESGKPLANTTPYKVYKSSGVITSGWANMSGADPKDYFVSANSEKSICLNEGEAALRELLNLSENSNNSSISTHYNQTVDVNLTRSLSSAQYNTFCLPFALTNAQLEEFFGVGYDLEEFVSSSLEGDVLSLEFSKVTSLEAGKPYLLQPSADVANPYFEGVAITETSPLTMETSYADLKALYAPTELEGGNHNILFLGENNTLFWPESTGNMNAFRAYFVVKGAAANAVQARIGRAESQPTAIENQMGKASSQNGKYLKDGQLLIERNGIIYNAQGQTIK